MSLLDNIMLNSDPKAEECCIQRPTLHCHTLSGTVVKHLIDAGSFGSTVNALFILDNCAVLLPHAKDLHIYACCTQVIQRALVFCECRLDIGRCAAQTPSISLQKQVLLKLVRKAFHLHGFSISNIIIQSVNLVLRFPSLEPAASDSLRGLKECRAGYLVCAISTAHMTSTCFFRPDVLKWLIFTAHCQAMCMHITGL